MTSVLLKLTAVLMITTESKSTIHSHISGWKHFIFLIPKILNHFRVITLVKVQSRVAAYNRKVMSHNPAMGLEFGCSHSCSPSAADSPRRGRGWPPQPWRVSCTPRDWFQCGGLWTATSQQRLWRTAGALSEDLGRVSGEWIYPGEPPKGGFIMGENKTSLRKVLSFCWQKG